MCCPNRQPPGLSAPGTDPRRRHLIKMEPRWKKKISEFLEKIPPLRGGDFQGIAGLSSDDSLLGGVNSGCVPALPASVSPGSGNFSRKTKVVRGSSDPSVCHRAQGAGSRAILLRFRSGEKYFLDIPLYRPADYTHISSSFDSLQIGTFGR